MESAGGVSARGSPAHAASSANINGSGEVRPVVVAAVTLGSRRS